MSGFLAWAADVVGGNGNGNGEDHQNRITIIPKFTKEEEAHVRELDIKASSLQRSLYHLGHRLHPSQQSPTTSLSASSLPNLHAEFLASNSALALEQQAHNSTRQQIQSRELTLREENASYEKAISAAKKEIIEKSREVERLNEKLKSVDEAVIKLQNEIDCLQAENLDRNVKKEVDNSKKIGHDVHSLSFHGSISAVELDRKRNEMKMYERRLATLEEDWRNLQNKLSQKPSPAQREKGLERRLRSLTDQLMLKQKTNESWSVRIKAQADNLSKEKRAIELRLNEANEARKQFHPSDADNSHRKKLTILIPGTSSLNDEEEKIHSGAIRTIVEFVNKLIWLVESVRIGGSRRFMILRSMIAAYILALHLVFIIFAFVKLSHWH